MIAYVATRKGLEPGQSIRLDEMPFRLHYSRRPEEIFETVRLIVAPHAPSRLECVFACPTREQATEWWNHQSFRKQLYKVELQGNTFQADPDLFGEVGEAHHKARGNWNDTVYVENIGFVPSDVLARMYWEQQFIHDGVEILADDAIIVCAVDDEATNNVD